MLLIKLRQSLLIAVPAIPPAILLQAIRIIFPDLSERGKKMALDVKHVMAREAITRHIPGTISPPNDPAQACVNCHVRDNKTVVESENGLILDQQQSDELLSGAKFYFQCVSCHDPHASAHYNGSASGSGIIQECTNCHTNVSVGLGMQFLRCIDCHMPYAVNSGAQISYQDTDENNLKVGNVRTHVFTINAAAQSPAEMFSPDGKTIAVGSDGRAKGLTLDFVCQSCHRSGGFAATTYSFEQAKSLAGLVHGSLPAKKRLYRFIIVYCLPFRFQQGYYRCIS